MHASSVIAWDTSERTVPSTSAPCASIGPRAMLRCIAHFAVNPTRQPLPPLLPLLPAVLLPPGSLVQYLLRTPVDALTAKLCVSHLMPIPAEDEDEATILRTLKNTEAPTNPILLKKSTTVPPKPTSPDLLEGSTETIR